MEQVETPDLTELRQLTKEQAEQILKHGYGYSDEDFEHHIYEAAMKAFYGKEVFVQLDAMTDEN